MKKGCFILFFVLSVAVSAQTIFVPNSDFEVIYKSGSDTITGVLSGGDWTQGVGPDCPMDNNGMYTFSDGTTDTVADIPGWIGYDKDEWIALGGTYNRDETTGNLQGSIQARGVDGSYCYLANGSDWGNPAGGLIVSDAPLDNVMDGTYTLSMVANGSAAPVVLELLAGGIPLTPSFSVDPPLSGTYQEFSRTYDSDSLADFIGDPLTICLGVDRNATGTQSHFDNVSLTYEATSPGPCTVSVECSVTDDTPPNLNISVTINKTDICECETLVVTLDGEPITTITPDTLSAVVPLPSPCESGSEHSVIVKCTMGEETGHETECKFTCPVITGVTRYIGDANCDNSINLADAISILAYLFSSGEACCLTNMNSNGDDGINLADAITILSYLFSSGNLMIPVLPNGTEPIEEVGCNTYDPAIFSEKILPCINETCPIIKGEMPGLPR